MRQILIAFFIAAGTVSAFAQQAVASNNNGMCESCGTVHIVEQAQHRGTGKPIWVTTVRMKNGNIRRFEQATQPTVSSGQTVQVSGTTVIAL